MNDQSKLNSDSYWRIRKNIEETWPDWKIKLANDELITSKHGKKLRIKRGYLKGEGE